MKVTIDHAIAELKRELKQKEIHYPRWIQSGKISRNLAKKRYLAMKLALEIIKEKQQEKDNQGKLFS